MISSTTSVCAFPRHSWASWLLLTIVALPLGLEAAPRVTKIWDQAPHNAFTDLVRWRGAFYCTFREATSHVGGTDGKIRVLRSDDGERWEPVALVTEDGIDLRDPKISVTPDDRLMLLMGGSRYDGSTLLGQRGRVAFLAAPGAGFSNPVKVEVDPAVATKTDWVWRVTWHEGTGYGLLYHRQERDGEVRRFLRLLTTEDGVRYKLRHKFDFAAKQPGEATARFAEDGRMVVVVRDESEERVGWIGASAAPFTEWKWSKIDTKLGGPELIRVAEGWVMGTRYHTPEQRYTVVGPVGLDGSFEPVIRLPSGGDTSYPGFVYYDGELWASYYASHEGKSAVYLARIRPGEIFGP